MKKKTETETSQENMIKVYVLCFYALKLKKKLPFPSTFFPSLISI